MIKNLCVTLLVYFSIHNEKNKYKLLIIMAKNKKCKPTPGLECRSFYRILQILILKLRTYVSTNK